MELSSISLSRSSLLHRKRISPTQSPSLPKPPNASLRRLSSLSLSRPSLLHWTRISPTQSPSLPKPPKASLRIASGLSFRGVGGSRVSGIRISPTPLSMGRKTAAFPLACASKEEAGLPDGVDGRIVVGSVVTIILAVANRVLYKLALVPMKQYPFFLAQVTTFGYVAVYFSLLYVRYRAGIVTKEMLGVPKSRFMAIGLLEALGVASGMAAGAMLPGPAIPILSQAFLVWQLILSVLILGRKYSINQIFGCLLVASGVVLAVASGANEGQFLSDVGLLWPALMITSSAFQACASIIKEFVFIDGAKRLQGEPLDIFVVNSFGSGFQALFVFLLLPFLSNLRGIPFAELPAYLKGGATCFLNLGGRMEGCEGAPLLPLLFITMNMAFNISLLNLVKMSSALVASLAATIAVPLSIYILSLPLPYIPQGLSLNTSFIIGTTILVLGLLLYNLPQKANQLFKDD